jgi:CRISPR-associated protein Csm1
MADLAPTEIALVVFQEIVGILATNLQTTPKFKPASNSIVNRAKALVKCNDQSTIAPLRSIFDAVKLDPQRSSENVHYAPLQSIADTNPPIPYPVPAIPDLTAYRAEVKDAIEQITLDDWHNLSFLSLFLEKYGSCLSFGGADIALNDFARSTAGVAAALAQIQMAGLDLETTKFLLIAGDLSGIQSFIYNISSDGALKSLRARSFFLELIVEEIVHRISEQLQLPRSNVIYAGGGNIYILAADTEITKSAIVEIRDLVNNWFVSEYQGNIFLAIDSIDFPQADVGNNNFAKYWTKLTQDLAIHKGRKFAKNKQLESLLATRNSHEPCKVCNRDDVTDLQPLNSKEPTSVAACSRCRSMFDLGEYLFKFKTIVRSHTQPPKEDRGGCVTFNFPNCPPVYYQVLGRDKSIAEAIDKAKTKFNPTKILLVDNWEISNYRDPLIRPILLGNYYKTTYQNPEGQIVRPDAFIRAEELAEKAEGIDRVGYLRMDVDRLGLIFAEGLGSQHNLSRLAGLSRQMSYFFKVYLNSLARDRANNLVNTATKLTDRELKDLVFIYTGGDDLFICGAWNQIAEFTCDIYQSFCAYTGGNPDITISGGIAINTSKYPLYRSAAEAGAAEHQAKENDKDSLTLFGETFKWSQWLGKPESHQDDEYLQGEKQIEINIVEMVSKLNDPNKIGYSRAFIRNLLVVADIRDRKIEALAKDANTDLKNALTYYLHLPKLAYALSRLPPSVRNKDDFTPIRQALLNPRTSPYFRAIATWVELLNRK